MTSSLIVRYLDLIPFYHRHEGQTWNKAGNADKIISFFTVIGFHQIKLYKI